MRAHLRLTSAGLLALLLTLGATGNAPAGAAELTKKDFVAAANTVCKGTNTLLDQVALAIFSQGPADGPTEAQIASFVETLVPAYRDLHDRIEELDEPRSDRKTIKKMLRTLERETDAVEDDPQRLSLATGPFPKFEKQAKKYGLTDCAPE